MEKNETQAKTIIDIAYKMSRTYCPNFPPVRYQFSKIFNHGMGALAFLRAVPEDRVLLVNECLASKRECERFENLLKLFKGWRLEKVRLGYPEWYSVRDLREMYDSKR